MTCTRARLYVDFPSPCSPLFKGVRRRSLATIDLRSSGANITQVPSSLTRSLEASLKDLREPPIARVLFQAIQARWRKWDESPFVRPASRCPQARREGLCALPVALLRDGRPRLGSKGLILTPQAAVVNAGPKVFLEAALLPIHQAVNFSCV